MRWIGDGNKQTGIVNWGGGEGGGREIVVVAERPQVDSEPVNISNNRWGFCFCFVFCFFVCCFERLAGNPPTITLDGMQWEVENPVGLESLECKYLSGASVFDG